MALPITVTITTASNTNVSTYTQLPLSPGQEGPSSQNQIPSQVMRITANINTSGGTAANLRFALVNTKDAKVYKYVDVTVTVTAVRTGSSGSTGNYVMAVTGTNDDFIDLTGYDPANSVYWYVGLAGAFGGSATSLELNLFPTRAI